ncbi:MAG: hypothetical protein OEV85_03810 [Candidatus Thorarchaeota archaeon]|nr:hypothetical protein [Candidatus Thorarchaeota archaeon]
MNATDFQNSTDQKKNSPDEIIEVVKIGLRHLLHGHVALFGFVIINIYFALLGVNLSYGNFIAFIPGLMLLITPLMLIIVGAMNSQSIRLVYNRRTSQHWASFLAQGFLVGLAGQVLLYFWFYLFGVILPQLLIRPWTFAHGSFMIVIVLFIPFILFIPSLGYASKELSLFFTEIKSKGPRQIKQGMEASTKDRAI